MELEGFDVHGDIGRGEDGGVGHASSFSERFYPCVQVKKTDKTDKIWLVCNNNRSFCSGHEDVSCWKGYMQRDCAKFLQA